MAVVLKYCTHFICVVVFYIVDLFFKRLYTFILILQVSSYLLLIEGTCKYADNISFSNMSFTNISSA